MPHNPELFFESQTIFLLYAELLEFIFSILLFLSCFNGLLQMSVIFGNLRNFCKKSIFFFAIHDEIIDCQSFMGVQSPKSSNKKKISTSPSKYFEIKNNGNMS